MGDASSKRLNSGQSYRRSIFVFGSNLDGIHGLGAARVALRHHGAVHGVGVGLMGDAYALPTKGHRPAPFQPFPVLSLAQIGCSVDRFLQHVRHHPRRKFNVTAIGCGLAGYTPAQVAPLFAAGWSDGNVYLPEAFIEVLDWPASRTSFDQRDRLVIH